MAMRINYFQVNPEVIKGLQGLYKHINSIDAKLRALVELRVSQINHCVYCVDMHSREAREAGETQQRLDCLPAWVECPFFDERERAALGWAEALANVSETNAPDSDFEKLKAHFSEKEIVDLTYIIAIMNTWNRIAVASRHVPVLK